MLRIFNVKTIDEYYYIRNRKIQKWIDDNFVRGCVTWEMHGSNAFEITDRIGDSLIISLDQIPDWY